MAGFAVLLVRSVIELVRHAQAHDLRDAAQVSIVAEMGRTVAGGLGLAPIGIGLFRWMPRRASAHRLRVTQAKSERSRSGPADTEDQLLRTVADATPLPIAIARAKDGQTRHLNPCFRAAFGMSPDQDIDSGVLDVFGSEADRATVWQAIVGGDRFDAWESRVRRADGSGFWALTTIRQVTLDGEAAVYFAFDDVTERRRMEQGRGQSEVQLQEAQKLEGLGVLAGGIAHDFNNLLMTISGNAALAKQDLPADSPAVESLDEIRNAAEMASGLSRQMLVYAGQGSLTLDSVDLSRLVSEMRPLLHASAPKKVEVGFELTPNLPLVRGDGTHLRQVVLNLVTNGGEAIGAEVGRVHVRTQVREAGRNDLARSVLRNDPPAGAYVQLDVSDSGRGMDAATRARVFDPFFSTKLAGRGLGLAAVLGIVRAHRGAIWVESQPGRGTTFTVLFPCKRGRSVPAADLTLPSQDRRTEGLVLLVDDDLTVRRVMARILERAGFTVLTAGNGRAAVEVYRAHAGEIGVVVLDLTMPVMNGEEAFREIRKIRADARVILASGYAPEDIEAGFNGSGLAGFLPKPSEPDQLVAIVRAVLEA